MKYALALTICLIPNAAGAGMPCSDRSDILSQLSKKYKEAPVAVGVANNGGLIEVLSSADGVTWTIIISMPNGKSCLLAAGEEWHEVEHTDPEDTSL